MKAPPIVWVLAPSGPAGDKVLEKCYDYSSSAPELETAFEELGLRWQWRLVTLDNYRDVIQEVKASAASCSPVVLNFCDGDGIHGFPGPEVVRLLEVEGLPFTGADSAFYRLTISKTVMKRQFDIHRVPTPAWEPIAEDDANVAGIFDRLSSPLMVKPTIAGGRLGIGLRSVVRRESELIERLGWLRAGFHGFRCDAGGIFVERFIRGREFTVMVFGSHEEPERALQPIERVFHPSMPELERVLSFDRSWKIYEDEPPPPDGGYYWWRATEGALTQRLRRVAWNAYKAVRGAGYGRVDLRMDKETGELFVLEVNSQPSLSNDHTYEASGYMFHISGVSFATFIGDQLRDAGCDF